MGKQLSVTGRHLPALDGVRALAVASVIAYHLGYGWAGGGFLGVDVFFVLSGFLITSLLVEGWMTTGSVGLPSFWGRRARRLLPGLLLMLVVVLGFIALANGSLPVDWQELRDGALATVGYVANWQLLFAHQSYFDRFAVPSPFKHTWSLAIEEQFYLVWPLLIAALLWCAKGRWRRAGLVLTIAGACGSAAWMGWLWEHGASVDRVYYGTDTRAFDLLAGAALAMATAGRSQPNERVRKRVLAPLGMVGLAVLSVGFVVAGTGGGVGGSPRSFMFDGGLAVCALASVALLADVRCAEPSGLARVLSVRPVRYIGRISYGLYLWHWPVIVELTGARLGVDGLALTAVRLAVTLALAVLSFHLVEQPIRQGWPAIRSALGSGRWRAFAVAPAAMLVTAGVALAATIPPSVATASAAGSVLTASGAASGARGPSGSGGETGVMKRRGSSTIAGAGGVVGRPITLPEPVSRQHPLRILLLGDSVMLSEAPAIEALFDSTGAAVVENHAQWGFGLTKLAGWQTALASWIATARPQLVVAMWSWDNVAAAQHPAAYRATLEQFVHIVLARGDGVSGLVFQQFPAPGPDNDLTQSSPDYDARVSKYISDFDAMASSLTSSFPGQVDYLPLGSAVTLHGRFATWLPPEANPQAPAARWLRVRQIDNVHFCPAGAARYATALYADLAPMFRLPAPSATWVDGSWTTNYLAYRYPDAAVCPDDHP